MMDSVSVTSAEAAIVELAAHHTAHLNPAEQIEVLTRVLIELATTIKRIADDERTAEAMEKIGRE